MKYDLFNADPHKDLFDKPAAPVVSPPVISPPLNNVVPFVLASAGNGLAHDLTNIHCAIFGDAAELVEALIVMQDVADAGKRSVIHVLDRDGCPLGNLRLVRERLTDGSDVFNIQIS